MVKGHHRETQPPVEVQMEEPTDVIHNLLFEELMEARLLLTKLVEGRSRESIAESTGDPENDGQIDLWVCSNDLLRAYAFLEQPVNVEGLCGSSSLKKAVALLRMMVEPAPTAIRPDQANFLRATIQDFLKQYDTASKGGW